MEEGEEAQDDPLVFPFFKERVNKCIMAAKQQYWGIVHGIPWYTLINLKILHVFDESAENGIIICMQYKCG